MSQPRLILDNVLDHAEQQPSRIYLTQPLGGGRVADYTWAQVVDQARRMAAHLKAQGFEPGARIAILSKNCAHFIMAEVAIWMAGWQGTDRPRADQPQIVIFAGNHGVTIFISSHILGEVSRLATRIGIIHEGHMIRESEADQLKNSRHRALHVNTADNTKASVMLHQHGYVTSSLPDGSLESLDASAIERPEKISALLASGGLPPMKTSRLHWAACPGFGILAHNHLC